MRTKASVFDDLEPDAQQSIVFLQEQLLYLVFTNRNQLILHCIL